ncbi:glycoside hydrolase superfamily [Cladochytrium replicatum]|nr:glycoside hydrolase superfamily [Cladochytrium replicatum]
MTIFSTVIMISLSFILALSSTALGAAVPLPSTFPPNDFLYGCAISAYQSEGAWNVAGKQPSIWDSFAHAGRIANNATGDVAADFYHQYPKDIPTIRSALGANSMSISLSWTRIISDAGLPSQRVNPDGVAHYNKVVDAMLANGLEPFVSLYHWDLPQSIMDKYAGWISRDIVDDFAFYADAVFTALGKKVKYWATLNEPFQICAAGYGYGTMAPGRCSDRSICAEGDTLVEPWLCAHNALLAHATAVNVFRTKHKPSNPTAQISLKLDGAFAFPYDPESAADLAAVDRILQWEIGWFADPIYFGKYPDAVAGTLGPLGLLPEFTDTEIALVKGSADYFAWDAYTSNWVKSLVDSTGKPVIGACDPAEFEAHWPQCAELVQQRTGGGEFIGNATQAPWNFAVPEGLRSGLKWIHDRYKPEIMYISENGMPVLGEDAWTESQWADDVPRTWWYKGYTDQLKLAIVEDKLPVKGYLAWSCFDNLEWGDGYAFRFGLLRVDYKDQSRHVKNSARFLKSVFAPDFKCKPRY